MAIKDSFSFKRQCLSNAPMSNTHTPSVFIIGAGPVGLTLAMDLAQRGIQVLVAEMRHRGEPPAVKCNHVSARSMEVFRRLGVAQALRNTGLPADYPNHVAYRTTVTGQEMSRIPLPARQDRYTATGRKPLRGEQVKYAPAAARPAHPASNRRWSIRCRPCRRRHRGSRGRAHRVLQRH